MTYKYLLSKSGPHSPGGAFSKAYNDQWYLKDFEALKLENNLPALPSLPNFDALKNGAREVKAVGKGPSDYDKLRADLYKYYREVFGTNNEEVFELILNSSFEHLLENLPQRSLKERAELLNNHAIQTFLGTHAIDCELALKSIGLSAVQIQRVLRNKPFLLEFMEVALRYNFNFKEDMKKILFDSFMKRDNV